MRVNALATIILLLLCKNVHVFAQQPSPSPAPERTGRSYSTAEISKTPLPPGPQARSPLTFNDVTAHFIHAASKTSIKYLLETMGDGVAIFDFDNDGRMDLFFTNGAALKDPMSPIVMMNREVIDVLTGRAQHNAIPFYVVIANRD